MSDLLRANIDGIRADRCKSDLEGRLELIYRNRPRFYGGHLPARTKTLSPLRGVRLRANHLSVPSAVLRVGAYVRERSRWGAAGCAAAACAGGVMRSG